MDASSGANPRASAVSPLLFDRLLPPGERATAAEIADMLGLWERHPSPAGPPRLLLNMVSSVDGRATLDGRSGPLSDSADRQLFHGLRGAVDAVLVGASTVRVERYGRLIPDEARRRLRRSRGLHAEPLACIVSASLDLDPDIPLFGEPDAHVAILTPSSASLPQLRARVDYVRAEREGALDLSTALSEVRERFGVDSVLCEGGPHLARQLLGVGLVSELFLSISPKLAGDQPAPVEALRIVAGVLDEPVELELLGVLRSGSSLFLRYGVGA